MKKTVSFRFSPYVLKQMDTMMETGLFNSRNELVEVAVLRLYEEFRRGEVVKITEERAQKATLKEQAPEEDTEH